MFTVMSLCIIMIAWWGLHPKRLWKKTVEEQLLDSESRASNKNSGNNKIRSTNVVFAYTHFFYGFCDGNSLTALRVYQHQYLDCRLTCV
jgi:hypothetical protein